MVKFSAKLNMLVCMYQQIIRYIECLKVGDLSRTLMSGFAPSAVEISESVVGREKDAQFLPLWLSDLKRALKDLNSAKDKR